MFDRVNMFGVQIDALPMNAVIDQIRQWLDRDGDVCRYVVTPNVDHILLLNDVPEFRRVYRSAAMVLADGWPIVTASRFLKRPLPERVPGSDVVPQVFAAAEPGRQLRVFLLGAAPGVADRAATNIHKLFSGVRVVGTYSPPLGFENDTHENEEILRRIGDANAELLVIGLGAPKQEFWIFQHRDRVAAKVALCVGATIDFLAGERKRAPRILQRLRLEWFHRLISEPQRLAKRYARDAWLFPQLVWREWRSGRKCHRSACRTDV